MSERTPYVYKELTGPEMEQVAADIVGGRIFHSGMCRPEELKLVFMILSLLDRKSLEEMQAQDIVFFYEYLDQAAPMSVNGNPSFMSVRYLNRTQAKIVYDKAKEIDAYLQSRKEGTH